MQQKYSKWNRVQIVQKRRYPQQTLPHGPHQNSRASTTWDIRKCGSFHSNLLPLLQKIEEIPQHNKIPQRPE
jgi:hypothetical protein